MSPELLVPQSAVKDPDSILGLTGLFERDARPGKINAGVGVFRDESGKTYIPSAIKIAMEIESFNVDYLGPTGEHKFLGDEVFLNETIRLVLGDQGNELLDQERISAIGTVGGTGAVSMFAYAIKELLPNSPILIGSPSWPNHFQIAQSRQIEVIKYDQMTEDNAFNFEGALEAIRKSPSQTVVLFHAGKSHNPTGVNPTIAEWGVLAKEMAGRLTFFDAPYLGLSSDYILDTQPMRIFLGEGVPIAVAVSYSKNCGIYNRRSGALIIPSSTKTKSSEMQGFLNWCVRVIYSSPPADGEFCVATMLGNPPLKNQWLSDLKTAVAVLNKRRKIFAERLPQFDFVAQQRGLFSLLPLSNEAVSRLRKEFAVYLPDGGRVNFGGVTSEQIIPLAEAINEVMS